MELQDRNDRRGVSALLLTAILALAGCSSPAEPIVADTAPTIAAEATPTSTPTSTPEATPETVPDPTPVPTTNVAGLVAPPLAAATTSAYRIQIARLGINLPIAEGDVPRDVDRAQTPEHYAFHLPGTSMFGPGNTYIYAHARVGMFLSLWNVRVGDVVIVRTPNGTREYVVEEVHPRVPPLEISWAGPTADTRLTLQTSTGPNGTDPRFVVVARPR